MTGRDCYWEELTSALVFHIPQAYTSAALLKNESDSLGADGGGGGRAVLPPVRQPETQTFPSLPHLSEVRVQSRLRYGPSFAVRASWLSVLRCAATGVLESCFKDCDSLTRLAVNLIR